MTPQLPFESRPVVSKVAVPVLALVPLVIVAAGIWFSLAYVSEHRAPAITIIVFSGLAMAGLMLTIVVFRGGCVLGESGIQRPDGATIHWPDILEYALLSPGLLGLTVQRRVNLLGTDGEVLAVPFRRDDLATIRVILAEKVGPERESRSMPLIDERL